MAYGGLDITTSKARFEALGELEQGAQWVGFIDGLDAGDAGYHPHYRHLASLYERGETPSIWSASPTWNRASCSRAS